MGKVVNGALAPSESMFPKLAGTEKSPSEHNTSINLKDSLQMVAEATSAHAPWIQILVNNQLEVVIGMGHSCLLKISVDIKLGN
jgi:hypothetical protein